MKKYFGFQYIGFNRQCTTGHPHPSTGRMSIAGTPVEFSTKKLRDNWVDANIDHRISITMKDLRRLHLGMTLNNFNEYFGFKDPDLNY